MTTYYVELRSQSNKSHRIRTIKVRADDFVWGTDAVRFRCNMGDGYEDVLMVSAQVVISVSSKRKLPT